MTHHIDLLASFGDLEWRKSRYSNSQGNCVELAKIGSVVAMRNSRYPQGPILLFPARELAAWFAELKEGSLDDHLTAV